MRNPIDIDSKHSRAIAREIGEGLRASFKEDRRVTRELQNANRTTPPIRRRDAAQRLSRVFEHHERSALRQVDRIVEAAGPWHPRILSATRKIMQCGNGVRARPTREGAPACPRLPR